MNKSLVNQNIKKNYQLIDRRQFGLAEQNAHNLLKHDPNNHEIFNLIETYIISKIILINQFGIIFLH